MKLVLVLSILIGSLIVAGQLRAETVSTRLTREKPGDHLYSFTIKVEQLKDNEMGKYLEVHVTVKPKPANTHPLPRRIGTLKVYAAKKFVSSCEVQSTERRGEQTYSFRVAAKHAEQTTFTFATTPAQRDDGPADSQGFYYWFYVKDFVESKTSGA